MQVTFFTCMYSCDKFIDSYIEMFNNLNDFNKHKLIITNILDSNNEETLYKINNFKNKFNNIKVIELLKKDDPGLYQCWNNMLEVIETDLVCNINPDDILHTNFLELLNVFNDNIDLVCCPLKIINLNGDNLGIWHNNKKYFQTIKKNDTYNDKLDNYNYFIKNNDCKFNFKLIKTNNFDIFDMFFFSSKYKSHIGKSIGYRPLNLPGCAPIWKKKLYNEYGGFDEINFYESADYELWCRYLSKGSKMFCYDKSLVTFRYSKESMSNNKKNKDICKKIFNLYHPLK